MADAVTATPAAEKVAAAKAQQQQNILITGDQLAHDNLAAEMAELADSPPDEHAVEGGVFEDGPGAGTFHNAHGEPVTAKGKPVKA